MIIKILKKHPYISLPEYGTNNSAGIDISADIGSDISIAPLARVAIPTGLFIEIPDGFFGMICPRSGLAIKHGISILNAPGIIDSDYRGEIQVIIINLSNVDFIIKNNMKIAQMIVLPFDKISWIEGSPLSETARGTGGFGSTGI